MARLWTPETADDRAMLLRWAEAKLPGDTFDRERAIPTAVIRGSKIAAVAVYFGRRDASIEMAITAATPRWATPGVIACLLATPFEAFNCRRITAIVRSDNAVSMRFVEGIGFRHEGTMRDACKGCDAEIYGLTKIDWLVSRWHRRRTMQEAA